MTTPAKDRRARRKKATRAEILEAARAVIEEFGHDGLTIRKLADRVGYAPMSVYSYFADKQEILEALARQTFEKLAGRIERERVDDPVEELRRVFTEYIAFAHDNPSEYRTIFMTPEPLLSEKSIIEMIEQNPALCAVVSRVGTCIETGALEGDPHAIATLLWSVAHGAASLLLTFPSYPFGDPNAYADQLFEVTIAGLRSRRIAPLLPATGAGS